MGNHLHKTTREYRESWDPAPADASNWIRNPDKPAGVASWSDVVIDGDTVRAPNEAELAAQNASKLAAAKAAKIAEIDARTSALVTGGITVAIGKVISTSLAATQNLQDLALGHMLGVVLFPQDVSTVDGAFYEITNAADLLRIAALLRDHKLNTLGSGRDLRADVLACTTLAAVEAITDGRT